MAYQLKYDESKSKKTRPVLTVSAAVLAAVSIPIIIFIVVLAFPSLILIAVALTIASQPKVVATIFITFITTALLMVALYYALKRRSTQGVASWLLAAFFPILMLCMFTSTFILYLF